MAKTREETPGEAPDMAALVEKLQAENKALKSSSAQKDRQTATALEQMQAAVKGGGPLIPPRFVEIPGTFTAEWRDPMSGEVKQRTVRFATNQQAVRLKGGVTVSSAAMMRLANGEKLTPEELAASPALVGWTTAQAAQFLTDLVKMGYTLLVDA